MEILLINIIFSLCIIRSLNTNISAKVKFEIGNGDPSRENKKLFKDYYSNLTPCVTRKSVIQDNDVLGTELCHTLGSAFGKQHYGDSGRKRCELKFLQKEIKVEESQFVWLKLGKCRCFGKKPLRTFYIREYNADDDISAYFVFDTTDWHFSTRSRNKYLAVSFVFDAAHKILWENTFHGSIQESKLTAPPPKNTNGNEIHDKDLSPGGQHGENQSEATNAL